MRKLILFVMASGLGSASGLLGCQSKNPDAPAAPKVVYQKDDYDPAPKVAGRELRLQRDVDLQDRLDFAGAASVKTHVQCGALGFERQFAGAGAAIVDVLPEEIVARDLRQKAEPCTLHFELRNANGSLWVLSHHPVMVHDDRPPTLTIGRDDGVGVSLLATGDPAMEGVRVRGPFNGDSSLACEDVSFTGPRFDRVVEFAHFDFARPAPRPDRDPRVWAERLYGLCRALVRADDRVIAFSAPYRLRFARAPIAVVDLALNMKEGFHQFATGQNLPIREFELRNPERFPRRLVLEGEDFQVRSDIMRKIGYAHDRSVHDGRYVLLEIPGQPPRAARREVTIPAGGSVRMRLQFHNHRMACRGGSPMQEAFRFTEAIHFTMLDPAPAFELGPNGEALQRLELAKGVERLIAPFPIDYRWYGPYTNNCGWMD